MKKVQHILLDPSPCNICKRANKCSMTLECSYFHQWFSTRWKIAGDILKRQIEKEKSMEE